MNAEQKVKDAEQMQKTHWCYWLPGMVKPAETPEGLESLTCVGWGRSETPVEPWADCAYRWPATQAEAAAWHWCQAHRVMIPAGYEVVDFRVEQDGDLRLTESGLCGLRLPISGFIELADYALRAVRPILRKRHVATWREAVAGDEADCPLCRHPFSGDSGTLLRVLAGQDDPYIVDTGSGIARWSRCEIMEVRND